MATEIERKFLVLVDKLPKNLALGAHIKQGYLSEFPYVTTRVRQYNGNFFLTIKGVNKGISRMELEYNIPQGDALQLFSLCSKFIEKTRVLLNHWEIDFFGGDNNGLVVAEIELTSEDEEFDKPEWLGEEVSSDKRYYNSNLLNNPYNTWSKNSA